MSTQSVPAAAQSQTLPGHLHALAILAGGRKALQQVQGLKAQAFKGIWVNLIIFFGLTVLFNVLVYLYVLEPLVSWAFGNDGGLATAGRIMAALVQLAVGSVFAIVALRFAFVLSSMWFGSLVSKVSAHFRPLPDIPFSMSDTLKNLGKAILLAVRDLIVSLGVILLAFIPVAGIPLVFVIESFLSGKGALDPYRDFLAGNKESIAHLKKPLRWTPLQIGWLPTALAFISFVGWALIPFVSMYQVIGVAWVLEEHAAKTSSDAGESAS